VGTNARQYEATHRDNLLTAPRKIVKDVSGAEILKLLERTSIKRVNPQGGAIASEIRSPAPAQRLPRPFAAKCAAASRTTVW